MKRFTLSILALFPIWIAAQNWNFEAEIKSNGKTGFHECLLPPAITANIEPGASNLRVVDAQGSEVPYLFVSDAWQKTEAHIQWLPKTGTDDWRRHYSRSFFLNKDQTVIDRIALKIRNADVNQGFWLSGSDDMNDWYIIKENFNYYANYDPSSTWNLLTIHFPPTDYKYYKVELKHFWREPIQIMGAGIYSYSSWASQSQAIPDATVSQREEGNRSIVDLHFDGNHYIDQLLLEVDGPEMYMRSATLQKKNQGGSFSTLQEFKLSSKALAKLDLEGNRGQDWRILIENKDDKPIQIAGAQARQRLQKIRLKLPTENGTKLVIGDPTMQSPEYDLAYFANDLPSKLPSANFGELIKVDRSQPKKVEGTKSNESKPEAKEEKLEEKPFYQSETFLWIGIIAIALVIGGMSIMLLKDMKKES